MRVTVVTRIFEPEPAAASQRLAALCAGLAAAGDDVTVITSTPPAALRPPDDAARPFRVRRRPVLRDRSGYVRGYLQYMSFDIPAFFRVVFGPRADIVVVEPPPTTGAVMRLACAIRRVPYAYYAADVWSIAAASTGASSLVLRAVRAMEAFALRGAVVNLAVSEGVAGEIDRLAPGAPVEIVGHGVDESVFNAAVDPLLPELDAVYLGTASEWHGATVFIEALALARAAGTVVRADFIGQGSDWAELQAMAGEAGLGASVRFSPPLPPEEAARRLRGARVALASVRHEVGYDFAVPTKAYSALAVGTPVLFSGPEPLRSRIVEQQLGWGCDDDPSRIAAALTDAVAVSPGDGVRAGIARWARENVSASAVAARARAAIVDTLSGARGPNR